MNLTTEQNGTVLLVDDDRVLSLYHQALLEKAGFSVRTALTPSDALRALAQGVDPDLVIVDYHLPEMTGPALAQRIRGLPHGEEIGVLLITADERTSTLHHALRQGVSSYLKKPLDAELFCQVCETLANTARQIKTARLSLQNALAELEIHQQAINQHAIVSMTDANGVITYCNDKFCCISGYTRPQLLGRTHRLIKSGHHASEFYTEMWKTLQAGKIWRGLFCNRAKNGELFWVDSTIVPFRNSQGKVERFIAIQSDITALQRAQEQLAQSEQRFRSLFENSPVAYQALDHEGRIVEVNDKYCHWLGYPRDKLLGVGFDQLLSDDLKPRFAELFSVYAINKRGARELRLINRQGQIIDALCECRVQMNAQGYHELTHCILVDVSELRRAQREIEAAARAKSDFLSAMSHEIRTPFNGILGMVDLLDDSTLNTEQRGDLQTIRDCGHTLLNLLNDILDVSKIEAGKLTLEHIAFDWREWVHGNLALFTAKAREKGLLLREELDESLPSYWQGDPHRLRQILLNLLGNAVKFTAQGEIVLRVEKSPETPDYIRISISDTGIGMTPETLNKLFQPFSQGDSSVARHYGGTGLGLVICKRLVELMGGQISVTSTPGVGSTFWFELPLQPAMPESATQEDTLLVTPSPSAAGLHILLVEDNPVNQKVALLMLEKLGWDLRVTLANNGQQAVEKIQCERYDLILMDCQMPGMDGYEATRQIRAQQRQTGQAATPIIAMTANAMPHDRQACIDAGMDDYLAKPVSYLALQQTLALWLGRAS